MLNGEISDVIVKNDHHKCGIASLKINRSCAYNDNLSVTVY